MTLDTDDEIMQDFLVEAGEIVEKLGEQLVDLENTPDDTELLNAVFRGFHTIKGGAGFLSITNLVDICHKGEDVFNILRQGDRQVDPHLMDVVLQVVDVVNEMFDQVRSGIEPPAADPALIDQLKVLAQPDDGTSAEPAGATAQDVDVGGGDITDDEFEKLLDAVSGKAAPAAAKTQAGAAASDANAPSSDEISDEEFEALLDELHGKSGEIDAAKPEAEPAAPKVDAEPDAISDDEFEDLLDQIHGKGKFKAEDAKTAKESAPKDSVAKVEPAAAKTAPAAKAAPAHSPQTETTVRVDTRRLDDIMNMVGELVLVRNRLGRLKATMGDDEVGKAVSNLDVVTADLQLAVMKTRMQPIKKVFGRFPRVVRDLARSMKKEINLVMEGEDTDLDKNLVEALADPLVHLVRNAVDHGIETPDDRIKAGKDRKGTVVLSAKQEGDHIQLSIEDDGAGMDADVLRKLAVTKGMMDKEAAARLTDLECFNLIFAPGFSTKKEISDVSGRGVGMDVVKTRIAQLNGNVVIDSELHKGSRIDIKVPLTLAIMPTLMVTLGDQDFALPLASVNEIFDLDLSRTNIVDSQLVVMVRERAMPLFYLSEWLVRNNSGKIEQQESGHVVVVTVAGRQVGFVVDQLIGQEEVVIKPLGAFIQGLPGLAGATITGDGRIALIIDVPSLLKAYVKKF